MVGFTEENGQTTRRKIITVVREVDSGNERSESDIVYVHPQSSRWLPHRQCAEMVSYDHRGARHDLREKISEIYSDIHGGMISKQSDKRHENGMIPFGGVRESSAQSTELIQKGSNHISANR